jgi:hypothetical protein
MAMTNERLGRHVVVLGGAPLHEAFPASTYIPLGHMIRLCAPYGDAVVDAAAQRLTFDDR